MGSLARATVVLLVLVAAACRTPPPPTRVLVVGLDGATWDVARPLLAVGEMPALAALIAHGVSATPVADPPLIAPAAWTTLFTGVPPSVHGVANWALAGAGYRKVPALWSRLDAAGRPAVLVNVPGTWKAERLTHGAIVADVGMARAYVGGAGAGAFVDPVAGPLPRPYDKLGDLFRIVAGPLAVGEWSDWVDVAVPDVEPSVVRVKRVDAGHVWLSPLYPADLGAGAMWPRELAGELGTYLGVPYLREGPAWSAYPDEVPAIFAEHLAQTTEVQLAAAHRLLKTKPWDLFAVVDPLPDRIEHAYWREYVGAPGVDTERTALDAERVARHRERVRVAYRDADRQLGELVTHAMPAWIVVVSAHGFGSVPDDPRGDHTSRGMLVVSGPALRGDAGEIPMVDVAPTIACLLDLPRDGMTGTVLATVRDARPACR